MKYILIVDKISRYVGFAIFIQCLILNSGCNKPQSEYSSDTRRQLTAADNQPPYEENIAETVEEEPEEVAESDPLVYESEAAATKVISVLGAKDTYTHGDCDPNLNKYKDYYVGANSFEFELTFNKPDTILKIENPTGYYTMSISEIQSPTLVTATITSTPTPQYKARNVRWLVTWKNGKTSSFYMKMIPSFSGNMYGTSEYGVLYEGYSQRPDVFTLGQQPSGWSKTTIDASWTPHKLDILFFVKDHYGIITNEPVQVNTRINGVVRQVWKFKVRERNAACSYKQTTKTVKWYPALKIPSASTGRDSAYQYKQFL